MNRINALPRLASVLFAAAFLFGTGCQQKKQAPVHDGIIDVTTVPSSAEITCDGEPASDMITGLAPGPHLITAKRDGYLTARKTVDLIDRQASVTLELEPITGFLLIHSEPSGAEVQVGTIASGTTPLLVPECPLGTHTVRFSKQGYHEASVPVKVDSRLPKKVEATLESNTGQLVINSFPQGATVVLDGGNRGTTPVTIETLEKGSYEVELSLEGYEDFDERVSVSAGETARVEAKLVGIPGSIRVVSRPLQARVFLDDKFMGITIKDISPVEPGTHTLRIEKKGYESVTRTVTVENEKDLVESFELVKNSGRLALTTYPAGVTVFINGEKQGVTRPKPLATDNASALFEVEMLPKGTHTLQLVRNKHVEHKEDFEVTGEEVVTINQELERLYIEDWFIYVRGRRWVGSKVEDHINGDVTLEVRKGIIRTFEAGVIEEQGAYVKGDKTDLKKPDAPKKEDDK